MTYEGVGVDYDSMDPFKIAAQKAALSTAENITRFSDGLFEEFRLSRGESAYLIETPEMYLAHVEEGLGTKNLVADAMYKLTGRSYYDHVAQCTLAMIVNDGATLGVRPLSVAMHLAAGSSDWFNDKNRINDLINGWKEGCNLSRCAWGGGETPTLKGIVNENTVVLSGSLIGVVQPKTRLIAGSIQDGDVIVIVESSGIHANCLTLARSIADKLSEGYLTKLSDGRSYGETLLDPTYIYVGLVEDCLNAGVNIHYAVNVTGHGWRKLMRSRESFTYVIDALPTQLPIFDFIQKHGPVDDLEAYGNLNMGAGFALYLPKEQSSYVIEIAEKLNLRAFVAGWIESGDKKVVIQPKNLEFASATLAVR